MMDTTADYFEQKRAKAKLEAERDLAKPIEQLLIDVHDESLSSVDERSREETLARTTARFASLLARLSTEAEKGTRNIIRLTWAVVVLTVALFLLTAYLCCEAYQKSDFHRVRHSIVIE